MFEEYSSQTISIVASLIYVSLGTVFWLYNRNKNSGDEPTKELEDDELRYPPSPSKRHWLWKHGEALAGDGVSSHDVIFLQWMKKLKSKVIMFDVPLLGRMIVVGDAAVAKHVLQSKAKNGKHGESLYPKSSTYGNIVPLFGRKSIVMMEGSVWSHQRRTFNPGFSPDYLRGIVATIARKCDRFLAFCETEDIAHDQPTDMLSRAIDLTSDVIAQVAFGEDWGYNSKDQENGGIRTLANFRDLTDAIATEIRNPIQRINPFHKRYIARLSKSLDVDMQRLVRRRIAAIREQRKKKENDDDSSKKAPQKDILSLALTSVLEANEEERKSGGGSNAENPSENDDVYFSHDDMEGITSQLKTFYFAGHDTTATTIAWAFWLLAKNPEALEKAREEILEHLGKEWVDAVVAAAAAENNDNDGTTAIIPEQSTTYENLQKCQYIDAITRETLRLYPPAASTRYAPDPDASFGKYKLGKCIVTLNFYAIQRDPDLWGADADEFRPERFLGDEGRKKINSFGFLPFSKGSRDCIGKYFALLEAKIALAALITRYDGTLVDPDKEVYTARLTSIPKNGCLVKLVRRRPSSSNHPPGESIGTTAQ